MAEELINERSQQLLKVLVERYIREGQPLGSKTLLQDSGLAVSAATVRNIMADLEERGLVVAPHTSAGRIPTPRGFRFFVDSLVQVQPLEDAAVQGLAGELDAECSPRELVASASRLLATVTAQAGLVTLPRQNQLTLRQVEFLPLSDQRVLVILVVNERQVENRVIHTQRPYTETELRQAANFITQRYAGANLQEVRGRLLDALRHDKAVIDEQLQSALDLAAQVFEADGDAEGDYVVTGERRLIESATPEDLGKLRDLFDAFERKRDILDLVDRCLGADGVQVFIGEEAGFQVLDDFSVVTAPYQVRGQPLGVLGVIGPTRMAYERVIPIVDVTARMLSLALDPQQSGGA